MNLDLFARIRPNVVKVDHSLSQSGQAIYILSPRPSDLFPAPLYTRSMAVWLSSQQQNSLLITKKIRSFEIIENPTPNVWPI